MKECFCAMAAVLAVALGARGEGTIQFVNSPLTRVRLLIWDSQPVPTWSGLVYGLFMARSNECSTLVLPLAVASTTTAGLIDTTVPYSIPGTSPGETVWLQVRAWPASYGTNWCAALRMNPSLFGETSVCHVTLGDAAQPTVVWQSAAGTSPTRFHQLTVGMLGYPPIYIEANDVVATEGPDGQAYATFTVTRRSTFLPYACCTNYADMASFFTTNGTAVAGEDYVSTSGLVEFPPGSSAVPVVITLLPDAIPEPDETFTLILPGPVELGPDPLPRKYIGTATITESYLITVRLDGADARVTFQTVAGRRYAIEASSNLVDWEVVEGAAEIVGIGGPMEATDADAGLDRSRFYRARLLLP